MIKKGVVIMRMRKMICMALAIALCLGSIGIPVFAVEQESSTPNIIVMEIFNT